MGFIRIKKINGKEYAYLVENKWYKRGFKSKGKGSRQTVSKYLGRVYKFDKVIVDKDFFQYKHINDGQQYLVDNSYDKIIKDLMATAVLISSIGAAIIGLLIFFPYIFNR